eukprot:CFRG1792T1
MTEIGRMTHSSTTARSTPTTVSSSRAGTFQADVVTVFKNGYKPKPNTPDFKIHLVICTLTRRVYVSKIYGSGSRGGVTALDAYTSLCECMDQTRQWEQEHEVPAEYCCRTLATDDKTYERVERVETKDS